mgnify:CR=1 FL=1
MFKELTPYDILEEDSVYSIPCDYYNECEVRVWDIFNGETFYNIVGSTNWADFRNFWEFGSKTALSIQFETFKQYKNYLTDMERLYLRTVVTPFKDQIEGISKNVVPSIDGERILFCVKPTKGAGYSSTYYVGLPWFEEGTQYKYMEADHWYTLAMLGLEDDDYSQEGGADIYAES